MTTKKLFEQLPVDEQEDFHSSCLKQNLTFQDFEVKVEEEYPTIGVGAINREATVVRLCNGKNKRYPAGNGEAWIVKFETDLLDGIYS